MEKYLHDLLVNNLFVFVFVVILIERIRRRAFRNIYTAWLFYLLGTFLHEMAHFMVSLLTYGKPESFSIIPKREGNSYIFGSVTSTNLKWYNKFLVSLAPLLILPLVYVFDMYYFSYFEDTFYTQLLYIFLIVVLIDNSIPSSTDFKIAFSGYSYVFWLSLIFVLFYFYAEVK